MLMPSTAKVSPIELRMGEKPFTNKVKPNDHERSGRDKEKELAMSNLRKLGYW